MTDQPARQPKPLVHYRTAMADAMLAAAEKAGIDTSAVRLPVRRDVAWSVTQRGPQRRHRK